MNSIEWTRHTETCIAPSRQDVIHFTFKSDEEVTIQPLQTVSVTTGIGFTLPPGIGGLVYPISGIFSIYFPRFLKSTGNEPLSLKIINFGNSPLTISNGQNIMKMLCQQIVSYANFPFTRLNETAIQPLRSEDSAGWILKSPTDYVIEGGQSQDILLGISTTGVAGFHAYVYPVHDFGVSSYLIDANENLRMRIVNTTNGPIRISIGDDVGLVALNEAIAMDLEDAPLQQQPINQSPLRGRKG